MSFLSPIFYDKNFDDTQTRYELEKILIRKRSHDFKMPKKNTPVILSVSGGLDSTMLWFQLMNRYQLEVYPIHFTNKYSPLGEALSVNYFYRYFKTRFYKLVHPVQSIPAKFNFTFNKKSSDQILKISPQLITNNIFLNKKTKNSRVFFVRNPIRLGYYSLLAYEYALKLQTKGIGVFDIFFGIVPDDGETTRESTLTVLRAVNVYLCSVLGDWRYQVSAPIENKHRFTLSKTKTILMSKAEQIPVGKTWSCGTYQFRHCGFCNPCLRRQAAFKMAKVNDPTKYWIPKRNYLKIKNFVKKFQI